MPKFKLLRTHCAAAAAAAATSPTRSPTASPVIHLRRRKTLRMLLGRGSPERSRERSSPERPKELLVRRHKLKDLLVSSPPAFRERAPENEREELLPSMGGVVRRRGSRPIRPMSAALRQRLLRRAWRPILVAIPE